MAACEYVDVIFHDDAATPALKAGDVKLGGKQAPRLFRCGGPLHQDRRAVQDQDMIIAWP